MAVALIVLAVLLGLAAGGSALQKLRRDPRVVESMHSVGVTDSRIPLLAILEILGVIGLIIGIWIPWLGVAAAGGLVLYFLGAVIAHVRVRSAVKEAMPAVVILLIAVATLVLELAR